MEVRGSKILLTIEMVVVVFPASALYFFIAVGIAQGGAESGGPPSASSILGLATFVLAGIWLAGLWHLIFDYLEHGSRILEGFTLRVARMCRVGAWFIFLSIFLAFFFPEALTNELFGGHLRIGMVGM